jgi:hypothetical protein
MGAASGRAARCATVSILDAANLAFLDHVALISNPGNSGIIESKRGKNGGTSAHWQIGLAYASLRQIGEPIADRFTADTI